MHVEGSTAFAQFRDWDILEYSVVLFDIYHLE